MIENRATGLDRSAPSADAVRPDESAKRGAFLRLFLQNQRRIYAYVLTLLPRRAEAEDVFQEASLVLWDKFDERQPPDDFAAWACRIAYFKVLDHFKKARRCPVRFSEALLERVGETAALRADALRLDERSVALESCLAKLSPRDRDLLTRRYATGATTESTARDVGRSVAAVYKALAKIRQALLECVGRTLAGGGV